MFKKFIKGSILSIVSLLTLTSCTMIDNIIGTILANVAINLPMLVNGIDLMPDGLEANPELMKWEKLPTNEDTPEDFNYLKNVLVIPNLVKANIFGKDISVELTAEFSGEENMIDNFKKISIGLSDLPEGFDFDLSALPFPIDLGVDIYIPIGDSDILDDVNGFNDLESLMETTTQQDLLDAANQETKPFSIKVSVKSARTAKSKTFYFRLTKPDFGTVILDEAFKLGMLVNLFSFRFNEDPLIEFKQDEAVDSENPLELSFLTDSLIIPKQVTIKGVSTINIAYDLKNSSLSNFFIAEESRNPSEFTSDEAVLNMIEGDISAYTFTPVGNEYNEKLEDKDISSVDEFADHIKSVTTEHNQSDLEDLYQASQSDPFDFELELTVSAGSDSRSESFFFTMKKAMLDAQILDFVIENEKIVQKVHYQAVDTPLEVSSDTLDLEMLTETLAFPKSITLPGFDTRPINFSLEFENESDRALFYPGIQELSAETTGFDGAELEVQTLTPIGEDYTPKPEDDTLEKFANTIQGMFDSDVEGLYRIVSYEHDVPIKVRLTASLEKDGEFTYSRERQITINLKPADVDKDIIDYLIDDQRLINIVNYEDIDKIQGEDGDPSQYIDSVGDTTETIIVEHLADTIIIPSQIELGSFEGKTLKVTPDITYEGDAPTFFESSQDVELDGFDIKADTITSTGGYQTTTNDLQVFAAEISDLDTKDLYKYSQAATNEVDIIITIKLEKVGAEPTTKSKTFTIEFVKAHISESKIAESIFATEEPYSVVNVLNADNYSSEDSGLTSLADAGDITLFYDTLIIPQSITFRDFGGKTITFEYDFKNDMEDYFFIKSKSQVIDEQTITVFTFTPVAGYDSSDIQEFADLIDVLEDDILSLYLANSVAVPVTITLTVTIKVDGVFGGTKDYIIPTVPASITYP